MTGKNKKFVWKKWQDRFVVLIIAGLLSAAAGFGFLSKFDYRLYDLLLGLRKEPLPRPELLFVEIDNDSLESMGAWPWSRDVLADALLRMKELGAAQAVFDIEYLSPSNLGVNPDAAENLGTAFADQKQNISDVVSELTSAVASGSVSPHDVPDLSSQMVDEYINPAIDSLYNSVKYNVYRDNDEYFASALQFFGNAWLTINIVNIQTRISDDDRAYVTARCLFKNVEDPQNLIRKGNLYYAIDQKNELGFAPALHQFISHAAGAGFTNIVLDSDGTRRRVELLSSQPSGTYVGQLVFAPLLKMIDAQKIVRQKRSLLVSGVLLPGQKTRSDILIPVDSHGRMMINWLHSEFKDSFRHESVLFLRQLDDMEKNIVSYLENLNGFIVRSSDGAPLSYSDATAALLSEYSAITAKKQELLGLCQGFDESGAALGGGITADEYSSYFSMRADFFRDVSAFLAGSYRSEIESRLLEMKKDLGDEQYDRIISDLAAQFDGINHEAHLYETTFSDMKKSYQGAFCIIGNSASSTSDLGTTPYNRAYPNLGTHANVYNTIMDKDFIIPVDWYMGVIAAFIVAFLAVFLTDGRKAWVQNVCGFASILLIIGAAVVLMIVFGISVPLMAPSLIVILSYIAVLILRFITSEKDKGVLRHAFSTYLAPAVVEQIVRDPEKLTLGGDEKHITALFTDIKGFSSFSELVTPTKLVSVLNDYLGILSDTILENGGTIDKYIGDAIVSFFGAPISLPDHAWYACIAAIRMKQAEQRYNDRQVSSGGIPRALSTRIGINTGNMVVGNMGTKNKMNYTIMGNDVNLASRLEGVNKLYHSWILASETTWKEADRGEHQGLIAARRFDRVRVVGIDKPVQLYNILGLRSEMTEAQLHAVKLFEEAVEKYREKAFAEAGKLFISAHELDPQDEAPLVFAARCREYIEKGVPDDWNGVLTMTTK